MPRSVRGGSRRLSVRIEEADVSTVFDQKTDDLLVPILRSAVQCGTEGADLINLRSVIQFDLDPVNLSATGRRVERGTSDSGRR